MSKPKTLILRTAGTNCDAETAHAFQLAGADTDLVHVNRLLQEPGLMSAYQMLAIPGGFSYGDDIAAGRIFANQIRHHLGDVFREFVDAGKPIIGICNGFQVLVKTDLLPGPLAGRTGQTCTLTNNDCGRFTDRWIRLAPRGSKCIWTAGLQQPIELPIAHGEGKFVPADDRVRAALWDNDQVALIYTREDGSSASDPPGFAHKAAATGRGFMGKAGQPPHNPNGSIDDIAGVCDGTGLVFGLMPHPERFVTAVQHPAWTRRKALADTGEGLAIFQSAVKHVQQGVGAGF